MAMQPLVDCHTHVFCWGERPEEGFLSEKTRRSWLTRLLVYLTGAKKTRGETMSDKTRHLLLRHVDESRLDYVVLLAQDAVYRADGSRDDANTHFYVSNDYVLRLAEECPKILPGCSINPLRADALRELDRVHAAGGRLIKIHTAIQGVAPDRQQFAPFYHRAAELEMVLMFHTGYEHSCTVVSQKFTNPALLGRALDSGAKVIAAHCGTCAFFDREDYYPAFVRMMQRHDNLYGDTAVLASLIRWRSLARLSREPGWLKARILHGSDYPLPPSRLPYLFRTGLFPPSRHNPLTMDLAIKQTYDFGPRYACRILDLLGVKASRQDPTARMASPSLT